jgi:2',3'-cyclic-nucleotide 2'-phosphodiesterase (5'-nucleotidase family)
LEKVRVEAKSAVNLRILHVNDVHSRFEQLARIATAIEGLRDKNTLVLDAGDNADFARMETEGTNGRISSALLNRMGFTARVFGNNEGFAGKENGRIIADSSNFPPITCNMYDLEGRKLCFLEDATIVHVSDLRVLIVGVTAPMNVFHHLFGIHVKDPEEEVDRVLAHYSKDSYDLLVVLSHLGLEGDKKLASRFPNIHVIIGGHSHSILSEPAAQGNTVICQAGHFGEYLGELNIEFDAKSKKIRHFEGRLLPSLEYPESSVIMSLIRRYAKQADRNLSKKLYSINITLDHSLTQENAIGNLLADALKDIMSTEIGIINSGVLNGGIKKGAITKKMLHQLCPSPLNPTYIEIKGMDIWTALEKSLTRGYQLSDGRGAGFRGNNLGNIQVSSNVQVNINPNAKPTPKIRSMTVDGKTLNPERWYTVATSDYLQRGSGYEEMGNNRNERYRPEFLRDILEQYLKKQSFLNVSSEKRFVNENTARQVSHP